MGFIEKFFKKKGNEITSEDISIFISKKIEENLNLDYKHIDAFYDFDELSKDVSAFANSEGGLIILGVSEEKSGDKNVKIFPKEITWGSKTLIKEQLEDNLLAKIQPYLNNLIIQPIRKKNDSNGVIFLLDIPKSDNPPHMASDNKYYKRLNFKKIPMEHYEIANLFKLNWTMKDKLIEEIYIPLSSILERYSKELVKYSCPHINEVEQILSKTFYKMIMPSNLLENIEYYIEQIKELNKMYFFAKNVIKKSLYKNVCKYLDSEIVLTPKKELRLDFKIASVNTMIDLYDHIIFELLFSGKNIQKYVKNTYYQDDYNMISVIYDNVSHPINIKDFEEHIWNKCLIKTKNNTKVIEMKKTADYLYELSWDLIEELCRY